MPTADIPPSLRQFLMDVVHTYDELEILLLLYSRRPQADTAQGVAETLSFTPDAAGMALDHLTERGVLVRSATTPAEFHFPAGSAFEATTAELRRSYAESRIAIVQLMSQNALDRLKKSALLTFAEAFRLRGRKDG